MGLATSSKYYIVRSARTRAEQILNQPMDKVVDACRTLYDFCCVKSRSPVLAKEKSDILFAINRIESANFALQEENISPKAYKRQMAEAVTRLSDCIARMKERERQLKAKAIGAGEDEVVDDDAEVVAATSQVKARKISGLADLQEAFKQQQQEMSAADTAKKAALKSQGYFDDETLAQKSMSIISSFDNERLHIRARFDAVDDKVNRITFSAAIMVRVESPLPPEIKQSKQRIHSIGSGFFIFEKQTLVAYREKYDGKALTDLRPMKEDYFFTDTSVPFKEIRWFVPAEVHRFMRGVRFSVLAFPWSRNEKAKKDHRDERRRQLEELRAPEILWRQQLPPAETRRIVEALVEAHPTIVGAKSKLATITSESLEVETSVKAKQDDQKKLLDQIESLQKQRENLSAIQRVVLDKQVRGLKESAAAIGVIVKELSERGKQLRANSGQLNRLIAESREKNHEKYLLRARMLIASGEPFTPDTFMAEMRKRIEKSREKSPS